MSDIDVAFFSPPQTWKLSICYYIIIPSLTPVILSFPGLPLATLAADVADWLAMSPCPEIPLDIDVS